MAHAYKNQIIFTLVFNDQSSLIITFTNSIVFIINERNLFQFDWKVMVRLIVIKKLIINRVAEAILKFFGIIEIFNFLALLFDNLQKIFQPVQEIFLLRRRTH